MRGAAFEGAYGHEARESVRAVADRIDASGAMAVLEAAGGEWSGAPVWVHGDFAAGNMLFEDGRLSAVIDFGSSAVGDPACDLVIAWVFLEGEGRAAFREAVGAGAETWARARGWALWKAALMMATGGVQHPAEAAPAEVIAAVIAEHRRVVTGAG